MLFKRKYFKRFKVYIFTFLIGFISCEKDITEPETLKLTDIISEVRIGNNTGTFIEGSFPAGGFGSAPVVFGTHQVTSNGLLILQVQPMQGANQLLIGFGSSSSNNNNYFIVGFDNQIFNEGYFVIDLPDSLAQTNQPNCTVVLTFAEKEHIDSFILEIASGNDSNISQSMLHSLAINSYLPFKYSHIYTHTRPDGINATAEVGIWMFDREEIVIDAIADWLDRPYKDKILFEPINVLWIDYISERESEAIGRIEDFFENSTPRFTPESGHSDGYFGVYGDVTRNPFPKIDWKSQNPASSGRAWADNTTTSDNNHGRIFPAYHTVSSEGNLVFFTTGAFSRETGLLAGHDYISFNEARNALTVSGGWVSQRREDFGNIYPYDPHLAFSTSELERHNGVRIFALYDYDKCDGFPPLGEISTYRIASTSQTFSVHSEAVNETVAGYSVYRLTRSDSPPNLGEYYACDPEDGEIEIATDWWELGNPSNTGRHFYEPPLSLSEIFYNAEVGTQCEWVGTLGGTSKREIAEVIGYETISIPYGIFLDAMKIRDTRFGNGGNILWDNYVWVSEKSILLKSEELDGGNVLELINYTPPTNKLAKKRGFTGLGFYRNHSIKYSK